MNMSLPWTEVCLSTKKISSSLIICTGATHLFCCYVCDYFLSYESSPLVECNVETVYDTCDILMLVTEVFEENAVSKGICDTRAY